MWHTTGWIKFYAKQLNIHFMAGLYSNIPEIYFFKHSISKYKTNIGTKKYCFKKIKLIFKSQKSVSPFALRFWFNSRPASKKEGERGGRYKRRLARHFIHQSNAARAQVNTQIFSSSVFFASKVWGQNWQENVSNFGRLRRRHPRLVLRDSGLSHSPIPESDEAVAREKTSGADQQVSRRSQGPDGDGLAVRRGINHQARKGRRPRADSPPPSKVESATAFDGDEYRSISRRFCIVRRWSRTFRDVDTRRSLCASFDVVSRPATSLHRSDSTDQHKRSFISVVVIGVVCSSVVGLWIHVG